MFNQVDPGINQLIGSYLDYESRINFGRVLPDVESRFVKRLDSDSHNTYVKRSLLQDKMNRFYLTRPDTIERCNALKRILLYLLHTKDEVLFKNKGLPQSMKITALHHADPGAYGTLIIGRGRRSALSTMKVAGMLVSYLETKMPNEHADLDTGKLVQIT